MNSLIPCMVGSSMICLILIPLIPAALQHPSATHPPPWHGRLALHRMPGPGAPPGCRLWRDGGWAKGFGSGYRIWWGTRQLLLTYFVDHWFLGFVLEFKQYVILRNLVLCSCWIILLALAVVCRPLLIYNTSSPTVALGLLYVSIGKSLLRGIKYMVSCLQDGAMHWCVNMFVIHPSRCPQRWLALKEIQRIQCLGTMLNCNGATALQDAQYMPGGCRHVTTVTETVRQLSIPRSICWGTRCLWIIQCAYISGSVCTYFCLVEILSIGRFTLTFVTS